MWINYRQMFCAMATAGAMAAFGGASVEILTPPATIEPGQSVQIQVHFDKTSNEPEQRVVVRVDLHDADTDVKVASGINDNSLAGYTDDNATIACGVSIPANASGAYYFKAWVVPWSLNKAIVAHYKTYPTDGTFSYEWPGGGYGVTQDIYYKGVLIAPKPTADTTYCSGVAFETFVLPFKAYNVSYGHQYIGNIQTGAQMKDFRKRWYGVTDAEKLAARAIPEWGAGREITDFEEAQEGDFIQLWRHSGSGHNPLFISWIRDGSGQITGVNYWGSQGSTDGIGYNDEYFGDHSGINRDRFYIGRAAKPRDQADYDWALGETSTESTPSVIGSGVDEWAGY